MKRRLFLAGAGLGLAAPAVVTASNLMRLAPLPETLWGDGVHDDTGALQSLLDGRPVFSPSGEALPKFRLVGGTYRISGQITIRKPVLVTHNAFLKTRRSPDDFAGFYLQKGARGSVFTDNCLQNLGLCAMPAT
ncbi:hypothetical protein [Pseudorhodoferax sp. Leaf274]|uniref:hypothetical protein n=1 Tax=Pseudorhodoferax sp. Leaf274 TaxID=1736318 RepID=UPI0012E1322C|nr:hypothetical protein [Pseudorhodoferax sp. Leaf274]